MPNKFANMLQDNMIPKQNNTTVFTLIEIMENKNYKVHGIFTTLLYAMDGYLALKKNNNLISTKMKDYKIEEVPINMSFIAHRKDIKTILPYAVAQFNIKGKVLKML